MFFIERRWRHVVETERRYPAVLVISLCIPKKDIDIKLSESKFRLRNCPYKKEARLFEPHCNSDSKDNSLAIADVNVIAAEQLNGPLRWRNKN